MKAIDITVIMVSYNTEALLPLALNALQRAAKAVTLQVIIVDNASRDGSVELIRRDFPECELIVNQQNVGFGRANNQALELVRGRYVLLLNTDAFVAPDTLRKTLTYMDAHPRCGVLGVRLVGRDGEVQPSALNFMTPWALFLNRTGWHRFFPWVRPVDDPQRDTAQVQKCDWVPGCYYLIRKRLIDEVGLFDPRYFLYSEEVDHCFAAKKAGWDVIYFPETTVVHLGGESARSSGPLSRHKQLEALQIESELLFFRKNNGMPAVIGNLLLVTLANLIDLLKCLLKHLLKKRQHVTIPALIDHTRLAWSLFWRTRCGLRPTR
ncbi:MAG: glycosyltransferase family 2 protein [Bacteroidota bacterium]